MPHTIREGIFTVLFISGPLVILAAALGLAIGIIQAATQVQEQTIGSAVKIIGIFLALVVFGFYMFQYMSKYTSDSLENAFKMIPKLGSYVLPRRNFLEVAPELELPSTELPELPSNEKKSTAAGSEKLGLNASGPTLEEQAPAGKSTNPFGAGTEAANRPNKDRDNLKSLPLPNKNTTRSSTPSTTQPAAQAPRATAPATTTARPAAQAPRATAPAATTARPAAQAPRATAPAATTARPAAQAPRATAPTATTARPAATQTQTSETISTSPKPNSAQREALNSALDRIRNSAKDVIQE